MKTMRRGAVYGLTLVALNYMIGELASYRSYGYLAILLFMLAGIYFLTSEKLDRLFLCGFTAMFTMFAVQICLLANDIVTDNFFAIYVYGLEGTVMAVCVSAVLTLLKVKTTNKGMIKMEEYTFSKNMKIRLLLYALITAVSFSYLVMPEGAGISIILFALLQAVLLYFVVPERKKLLWYIPVVILCLNPFISANTIWRIPNFIICALLYSLMFVKMDIKSTSLTFIGELIIRVLAPLEKILIPIEWLTDIGATKKGVVKRGLIAVVLSIASVILLCGVLSSADMVFSHGVGDILNSISDLFSLNGVMKCIIGIIVGFYLFGVVYSSYEKYPLEEKSFKIKGDLLIIGSVIISILAIYTIFVVIQFRYLFAGETLPYGLNVTEYARKGFFELLALSGVNIAIILFVTKATHHLKGTKLNLVKGLNMYLCAVTVVLLASSFYRMWLYSETDGLTRLRFLVFGFLIFECIGLVITFFYIAKPRFNIVMVYGAIALCYYLLLNLVPMDAFVAKNQVDRYLSGERSEIDYVFTLSPDAAEEVYRAYSSTDDIVVRANAYAWAKERLDNLNQQEGWQCFNLSEETLKRVYQSMKTAP